MELAERLNRLRAHLLAEIDHRIAGRNVVFQQRQDKLAEILNEIGLKARIPKVTFCIWARIRPGYASIDHAKKLLDEAGIVVTPGAGDEKDGASQMRVSLTTCEAKPKQTRRDFSRSEQARQSQRLSRTFQVLAMTRSVGG